MATQPANASNAAGGIAIALRNVSKSYGRGSGAVQALRDVNATFGAGSFAAVMGPSGESASACSA